VIFEQEKIDHSALMTHPSNAGLPQSVVNIPDKPVLSDLFQDHLASVEYAHADEHIVKTEGAATPALSSTAASTSIPVPIEVVMRQPTTSTTKEVGTLVSRGWWEGR
jgi:hypothetical protein